MNGGGRQFEALTGIRGVAAWLVVLYHTRLALIEIVPQEVIGVIARGYLAVDLFFMLSGFVIYYNYADRLQSGGLPQARQYLWRRFARVWPLHAFILSAYLGFVAVLVAAGRDIAGYPLRELPMHLLLVQNWGFTERLAWNHPAWSISAELAAYLVFPLLALAGWHRLKVPGLLLLAATVIAALHLKFVAAGHDLLGAEIPQMGLWRCLCGFTLGTVLCLVWQQWRECSGAAIVASAACGLLIAAGIAFDLPETALVPTVFFSGLLALVLGKGVLVRLLGSRPLLYLGEISYSTYLGHYLLWAIWKIAFVDESIQVSWASLGGFLLTVLGTSVALHRWIERPAQRWLNAHPPRWAVAPRTIAAQ